ncbi:MAG: MerR family transcriptional regulator [Oscillibacter sp.]
MYLQIHEVARRSGVTVRTLHYYDEIGLLTPGKITEAGYRIYDEADLTRLQEILFFRELDFPLGDIGKIMHHPGYDREKALQKHRELLLKKRQRLDGLLALLDQTMKGENTMNFKEFDTSDLDKTREKYAQEVRQRWGATDAYRESQEKSAGFDAAQWKAVDDEGDAILQAFGDARTGDPAGGEAQALVARWQAYITARFYCCTKEILQGLGQMYLEDSRFTQNIDRHGPGTAAWMAQAIEIYCTKYVG